MGTAQGNGHPSRGGSFNNQTSNVRSANRNNNQPDNRNNNNGFRAASTLRQDSFSVMSEFAGGPGDFLWSVQVQSSGRRPALDWTCPAWPN